MKGNFFICIETMHCPDAGKSENVHGLPPEKLKNREVVFIDIANDPVAPKVQVTQSPFTVFSHLFQDYKEAQDPTKFKSVKTGRGPLGPKWQQSCDPVMTCYKLVTVEFKWFGLQTKVESMIQKVCIKQGKSFFLHINL